MKPEVERIGTAYVYRWADLAVQIEIDDVHRKSDDWWAWIIVRTTAPGIASHLAALGEPAVVVHGANAARDDLAERLGAAKRTVTSESGVESVLTDDEALDVLTMAYAGLVNKRFVALCQRHGVNAIGLTGLDGALVRGRRNRGDGRRDHRSRSARDPASGGGPPSAPTVGGPARGDDVHPEGHLGDAAFRDVP